MDSGIHRGSTDEGSRMLRARINFAVKREPLSSEILWMNPKLTLPSTVCPSLGVEMLPFCPSFVMFYFLFCFFVAVLNNLCIACVFFMFGVLCYFIMSCLPYFLLSLFLSFLLSFLFSLLAFFLSFFLSFFLYFFLSPFLLFLFFVPVCLSCLSPTLCLQLSP